MLHASVQSPAGCGSNSGRVRGRSKLHLRRQVRLEVRTGSVRDEVGVAIAETGGPNGHW